MSTDKLERLYNDEIARKGKSSAYEFKPQKVMVFDDLTAPKIKEKKEMVNHPNHYNKGIEVIKFIESWKMDFSTGNVIKYVTRAPFKGKYLEDLKKARFYLDRLIKRTERKLARQTSKR